MNDKAFERKVNQDFDRAKKDLAALREDAVIGLSRKFDQLADGPKKSATDAMQHLNKSATVAVKKLNKSIGQGLSQYNTKVQDVVDKVPGDLGRKAVGYPWVAITASMVVGLMLGALLKLSRHTGS